MKGTSLIEEHGEADAKRLERTGSQTRVATLFQNQEGLLQKSGVGPTRENVGAFPKRDGTERRQLRNIDKHEPQSAPG